jgi:RNA polymerase sigma-70 factor (ECF subfamily)
MDEHNSLADRFEANRPHLRGVAYRMLGSASEADDAVQEAWLRLSRTDATGVENLGGWLTTVVARVCLDMLRARKARREDAIDPQAPEPAAAGGAGLNAERDMLLADSIGLALLVVLETLAPPERVAFVLHDMFDLPFEEIASIVGRSPAATRQLASRARRRVRGTTRPPSADLSSQRQLVKAFLAALQAGNFEALVAVLDPDVIVRTDMTKPGVLSEVRGAANWARGAVAFSKGSQFVRPAMVNGVPGLVLAPGGRLVRALSFVFANGKISEVMVMADRARLDSLDLAILED